MFKHQSSISFYLLSFFCHGVFYAPAVSFPLHPMLYRLSPIPNLLGSIAHLRSFLFDAPYPQSCISSNLLSFVFYLPPLFACALVAYALRSLPVLSSTPCPLSCVSTICSLLSVMFYLRSSNLSPPSWNPRRSTCDLLHILVYLVVLSISSTLAPLPSPIPNLLLLPGYLLPSMVSLPSYILYPVPLVLFLPY